MWLSVLAFLIGGLALTLAVRRWTRPVAEPPDLKTYIASRLGISTTMASQFTLNVPLSLTRNPGSVIAADTEELLSPGMADSSMLHRSAMSSFEVDLSELSRGGGRLAIPLLGISVSGDAGYDVHLALDSARVVEMTDRDLRAVARATELGSAEQRERASVVRRVIEANVALTLTRGDTTAHAAWVRDSTAVAEGVSRSGGRLDLARSSRRHLVFRSARTVVAFQLVPFCRLLDCRTPTADAPPDTTPSAVPAPAPARREPAKGPAASAAPRHPVHIFTSPRGSVVRVDGTELGAGHRTVFLPAGAHAIEAYLPGYRTAREITDVAGETTVTLELVRQ